MLALARSAAIGLLGTALVFLAIVDSGFAEEERRKREDGRFRNLVLIREGCDEPPLFWIHGDRSDRLLPELLEPTQPLYALKHQGRHGEPVKFVQVETIARHYLSEIKAVQPHGPYYLGGYSFGGTVAFEVARQLCGIGDTAAILFMVDPLSPGTPVIECSSFNTVSASVSEPVVSRSKRIRRHFRNFVEQERQKRLNYVVVRIKGRLESGISPITKLLKRMVISACLSSGRTLPHCVRNQYILNIYYHAIEKYHPEPYYGKAIYIRSGRRFKRYVSEWARFVVGGLDVYEISGDHTELLRDKNMRIWAETLNEALRIAHKLYPKPYLDVNFKEKSGQATT